MGLNVIEERLAGQRHWLARMKSVLAVKPKIP